jgi:hypothetical protein
MRAVRDVARALPARRPPCAKHLSAPTPHDWMKTRRFLTGVFVRTGLWVNMGPWALHKFVQRPRTEIWPKYDGETSSRDAHGVRRSARLHAAVHTRRGSASQRAFCRCRCKKRPFAHAGRASDPRLPPRKPGQAALCTRVASVGGHVCGQGGGRTHRGS